MIAHNANRTKRVRLESAPFGRFGDSPVFVGTLSRECPAAQIINYFNFDFDFEMGHITPIATRTELFGAWLRHNAPNSSLQILPIEIYHYRTDPGGPGARSSRSPQEREGRLDPSQGHTRKDPNSAMGRTHA